MNALPIAWGKSRKPLELTEQELATKVDELRKRHPELTVGLWKIEGLTVTVGKTRAFMIIVDWRDEFVFTGYARHLATHELTCGAAFKALVLACQAVEGMRAL